MTGFTCSPRAGSRIEICPTVRVLPLAEERSGWSPAWKDYGYLRWVHRAVTVLFYVSFLSFLVTTPEVWVPDLGSGEHGFPLLTGAGRLVIKDTAILAGAIVALSDCARRILRKREE